MDIGQAVKLIFNTLPYCVCIDSNGDYVSTDEVYDIPMEGNNVFSTIYVNTTPHFLKIYYESELGEEYKLGYIEDVQSKAECEILDEIKKLYVMKFKTVHGITEYVMRSLNLGVIQYKNK